MKSRHYIKLFAACLMTACCLLNQASASLIKDNGSYTTVNGLDWLDWPLTENMTQTDAIANHSGWRAATGQEITEMLNTMFETSLFVGTDQVLAASLLSNPTGLIDRFRQLFGTIDFNGGLFTAAHIDSYGLVFVTPNPSIDVNNIVIGNGTDVAIYGATSYSRPRSGVALVRQAVSEPSSVAIFALSLMGFGFTVNRKKTHG
ncbi:hypothetical protein [Neptunicella sp.]|uniref:hypothetical protein n=1 Tax=Neptunicella sp. TaxID=2125986 RepID=UPI003F68C2A6